jgi:Cdc6-like AAA superfamily ATPase
VFGVGASMAGFTINQTFSQFLKRAERSSQERLVSTFVGIDNLVAALNSSDHRIIFGRRGTGKTHALSYIADAREKTGEHATLIDLRTIGSD